MNEENLALQITEGVKSNTDDETFEIKEVNAENSLNLTVLSNEIEAGSRSKEEASSFESSIFPKENGNRKCSIFSSINCR